MKKRTKKLLTFLGIGALCISSMGVGVYAMSTYLNWTGADVVVKTKLFISQATDKILAQEKLINKIKGEKESLEKQLEEALRENNGKPNNGGNDGWTEKDQQIIDLENRIIEKENEIAHLTQQLERANREVGEQGILLEEAQQRLEDAGINMYWTEE